MAKRAGAHSIPELPSDPQLPEDAITITVDHRQWLTHRELACLHNTARYLAGTNRRASTD